MITLQTFNNFATGTHNMGQLRLGQGGATLEKVNNHVHFTSKNNVQLTADENRAVRQALVAALEGSVHGDYMDQLRELLLGGDEGNKCLNRDFVKAVLTGVRNRESVDSLRATGRKLAERTFSLVDDAHNPVTSRKDVAYEKSVAEEFDAHFTKARKGIARFGNLPADTVGRQVQILSAWTDACNAVCNAASDDSRLEGDRKDRIIVGIRELITSGKEAFRGRALVDVTTRSLTRTLRQELTNLFKKNFIDEGVAKDYIQRLFPDTEFMGYRGVGAEEALHAIRTGECEKDKDQKWTVVGKRIEMLLDLREVVLADEKITDETIRNDISQRLLQLAKDTFPVAAGQNSRRACLNEMIDADQAAGKTEGEVIAGVLAFIRDDLQAAFLGNDSANADRIDALARYLTYLEMN